MRTKQASRPSIQHIAKYYFPNLGGMETATKELAEAAVALGYDVSCNASSSNNKKSQKSYVHNGVRVNSSRTWLKLFSTPIGLGLLFQKIEKKSVVHIHLPNPMVEIRVLLAILFSKKRRHNIVPFLHALPVGQGWLGKIWFGMVTTSILRRVNAVFVSDSYFFKAFPVLSRWSDKFIIMPFCSEPITTIEFDSLLEDRINSRTIVALGRLVPYKGFDILIKAWKSLKEDPKFSKHRLKIIGDGPQGENLKNLVRDLGIEDSVDFLGAIDETSKWSELRNASIFVAPSLTNAETFGISILEAMSYGLPVIVSDLKTGVSSLARGGVCGGVVAAGSINELASKMKELLLDIDTSLKIAGRTNLEYVSTTHTRKILWDRYGKFIENHFHNDW